MVGLARQHEIGTGYRIDQLLRRQLVTQRLRVLIGSHAHLIHDAAEAFVIKLAVRLEGLGLEDGLFHLVVADAQAQFTGILIQQRFIDQTVQHLLTHGLHVVFVGRQLGELIA